jgi:hypothetical protein
MPIKVTYSSATGYIRERAMQAAYSKLNQSTQRERARKSGEMQAYITALEIVLKSPEGQDSEPGYPEWHGGSSERRVLDEIERFVGGPERMVELGFFQPEEEVAA